MLARIAEHIGHPCPLPTLERRSVAAAAGRGTDIGGGDRRGRLARDPHSRERNTSRQQHEPLNGRAWSCTHARTLTGNIQVLSNLTQTSGRCQPQYTYGKPRSWAWPTATIPDGTMWEL